MSARNSHRLSDYPGFRAITVLFFGFLYLPIAVLVTFSFNSGNSVTVWDSFSFDWYVKALHNTDLQQAVLNTLIVASVATIAAVLIALPAALVLSAPKTPANIARVGVLGLSLPLVVPEIVIAIATLVFFAMFGIELGLGNIIIAHTAFCMPFALLPILARLRGIDHRLSEAAFDLYATRWQGFRYIVFPLLVPGLLSGAMLAFIVSFDNFIISLMVSGAGGTTLPLYVYGLVKTQITPELNAVSTGVLLLSLLLLTGAFILTKGKIAGDTTGRN